MEDDVVIVAVFGMAGEVLHSLGALVWEQLEPDIPLCCVDDCAARKDVLGLCTPSAFGQHILNLGLLIEDIPATAKPEPSDLLGSIDT